MSTKPTVFDDIVIERNLLCPAPGIYEHIPFDEYVGWDAINHTRLCRIDKSPLNYLVAPEREKSQAFQLGSFVHAGVLEPDSVADRYVVMPDFAKSPANVDAKGVRSTSAATTWCKQAVQSFHDAAKLLGKEVVTEEQQKQLVGAAQAFKSRPDFVRTVNTGRCELSIVWNDRHTGLLCKARIDCACPTRLIDLKTTDDSQNKGPLGDEFDWAIGRYSYHTQAAWYADGWETLTGDRLPFWFAVVTTQKPHQCLFAPLGEASMDIGRTKNRERMSIVLACKERDKWPGYENPVLFELPEKYMPEID